MGGERYIFSGILLSQPSFDLVFEEGEKLGSFSLVILSIYRWCQMYCILRWHIISEISKLCGCDFIQFFWYFVGDLFSCASLGSPFVAAETVVPGMNFPEIYCVGWDDASPQHGFHCREVWTCEKLFWHGWMARGFRTGEILWPFTMRAGELYNLWTGGQVNAEVSLYKYGSIWHNAEG